MMATAKQLDLGYLAWSWSGNTDPILDLSIGFDPTQLSSSGRRIFNGANGIARTSKEATICAGTGTDTQAPTAPAPATPAASATTATSTTLTWTASTDNVGIAGYDVVRVNSAGTETTVAASTTSTVTVTGLTAATAYPSPCTPVTRPATVRPARRR